MIGFGVGCFHFGVKKEPPFEFNGSEYIAELTKTLESVPGLRNLKIDIPDHFRNFKTQIEDKLPQIDEGKGFFPKIPLSYIEFEVYIPFDEQRKLWPLKELYYPNKITQDFKISMFCWTKSPIVYVEPLFPSNKFSPNTSVVIVREFLKNEFKKLNSDYIRFEWIGPSPFHADFYIKKNEKVPNNGLKTKIVKNNMGPDTVVFLHNSKIEDKNKITKGTYRSIIYELNFYYFILQTQSFKINKWSAITALIDDLISLEQLSIFSYLKNFFKRSKLLNEIYVKLIKFESNELSYLNEQKIQYTKIYSVNKGYLKYFIDKSIGENQNLPTEQLNRLINFFENRRMKNMEIFAMIMSGFIGGIIGVIVTAFF